MPHDERPSLPTSSETELSRRQFLRTAGQAGGNNSSNQTGQNSPSQSGGQSQTPPSPAGIDENGPSASSRRTTGALGSTTPGPSAPKSVPDGPPAGTGNIPRRPLGKTGLTVSALGLGGHHLGDADSVNEATDIVHEAIDTGVTFFGNYWEYHDGKSENWLGRALSGGRRDKAVLMTKVCTHGRTAPVAMQQLEESLLRLRTDHLDVWQIHECVYYDDPDLHFAPNGVWEAMRDAKQQGKVRFIGFTGHKTPQIHLRRLALADPLGLHFDAVQMPLNAFDATYRSFQQFVLPGANRRSRAVLGMKSLGGGGEPILHGAVTPQEALRYAMSLPAATAINGIGSLQVLHQNLAVARDFKPLSAAEMTALAQRCQDLAADGHLELYKSTKKYDANVGRSQYGYPSPEELPM